MFSAPIGTLIAYWHLSRLWRWRWLLELVVRFSALGRSSMAIRGSILNGTKWHFDASNDDGANWFGSCGRVAHTGWGKRANRPLQPVQAYNLLHHAVGNIFCFFLIARSAATSHKVRNKNHIKYSTWITQDPTRPLVDRRPSMHTLFPFEMATNVRAEDRARWRTVATN